ncbi:Uncharacterized conserved protein, DUF58 family, contains vWF domain [Paenibacillus sp. RU4T]|nr:Uncharacterized conserved protein, DUF58 family, contains vWF domain [Paenibacillus sp. RU4X]SIR57931.1 Uncharacterized conserved protein, DUF58 family, contains vWF domain [Paenibacillus sp. RU4T]
MAASGSGSIRQGGGGVAAFGSGSHMQGSTDKAQPGAGSHMQGSTAKAQPGAGSFAVRDASSLPAAIRPRRLALAALAMLAAAAMAAAAVRGGAAEWLAASVLGGVLALAALPGLWMAGSGLQAERRLAPGSQDGSLEVTLVIRGRRVLPLLMLQVREELVNESAGLKQPLTMAGWSLPWLKKEWTLKYEAANLGRGCYRFRALTVTAVEPFGLAASRRKLECGGEFTVLPQPEGDRESLPPAGADRPQGGIGGGEPGEGRRERRSGGAGPGTRPYREGDSVRHIDWRAAAKGRELRIKTDEAGPGAVAVVLLGSGAGLGDALLDRSAGLALAAMLEERRSGRSVRLQAGAGTVLVRAGGQGKGAVEAAARLLARLSPASMGTLAEQLDRLRSDRLLPHGCSLVMVTPDWQDGEAWSHAAEAAQAAGCRFEFRVPILQTVPSAAMRERMRWAQARGYRVSWMSLSSPAAKPVLHQGKEGGRHDGR